MSSAGGEINPKKSREDAENLRICESTSESHDHAQGSTGAHDVQLGPSSSASFIRCSDGRKRCEDIQSEKLDILEDLAGLGQECEIPPKPPTNLPGPSMFSRRPDSYRLSTTDSDIFLGSVDLDQISSPPQSVSLSDIFLGSIPFDTIPPPPAQRFSLLSKTIRVSQLEQHYATTGCPDIDKFLEGGFPTFGITEICGESGTGKTQLSLQLSITVQLPLAAGGLDSGAIFINTEQVFPSQRLEELSGHFVERLDPLLPGSSSRRDEPMDKIFVERIGTMDALLTFLKLRVPLLIRSNKVRLIIIDSLAALVRGDYNLSDMTKRTADLRSVSTALRELSKNATTPGIAIVVVNQMSANIPSLGLVWTNCVTTRIQLSRDVKGSRFMGVIFAPHLPVGTLPIELDAKGMHAKDNSSTNSNQN